MTRVASAFVCLSAVLGVAASAAAQDRGRVGLVMGYPASVGIIWHATGGVAIRPEFTVGNTSIETSTSSIPSSSGPFPTPSTTVTTKGDSRTLGVGISALFDLHRWDNLRAYFSPRFSYSDLQSTTESSVSSGPAVLAPNRTDTDGRSISVSGSFGAQYLLGHRFAVFGETGVAYSDSDSTGISVSSRSTTTTSGWGLRSGVGVAFYF